MLKEKSARRKREKQNPKGLPALPTAHKPIPTSKKKKEKIDPITKQPVADGQQFDMMGFMKRQLLAKEKEMLAKETRKPLSPTSKKPASIPQKDLDKLHEAEEKRRQHEGGAPGDDKHTKEKSLLDRLSKERSLREKQRREADPDYKPLSPTAKPKKKKRGNRDDAKDEDLKEGTIFEQMQKRRLAHERHLLEEDAKRAAEDPTYTPKFKGIPKPEDRADPKDNLKKRLDEARRKHLEDKEE